MTRRLLLTVPVALCALALPAAASAGETTIDSGPPAVTSETAATFAFSSTGEADRFQCKLDGAPEFTACQSPHALSGLGTGQHTLAVRAVGGLAGPDPTPATWTWTITGPVDSSPGVTEPKPPEVPAPGPGISNDASQLPPAQLAKPSLWVGPRSAQGGRSAGSRLVATSAFQGTRRLRVDVGAVPGAVRYLLWARVSKGGFSFATSQWTEVSDGPQRTVDYDAWWGGRRYCFRAIAVDAADRASQPAEVCTHTPYRVRSLAMTDGFRLRSDTSSYFGEYALGEHGEQINANTGIGKALDDMLSDYDNGRKIGRIAMVATKCPTCGEVKVSYVHSPDKNEDVITKTFDLRSSTTRRGKVLDLGDFTNLPPREWHPRRIIMYTVSGRPRIEGLGIQWR